MAQNLILKIKKSSGIKQDKKFLNSQPNNCKNEEISYNMDETSKEMNSDISLLATQFSAISIWNKQ